MDRYLTRGAVGLLLILMALLPLGPVAGQPPALPPACGIMAFSTEEDFVTQGPEPSDGNPILSDGDLLALETDAAGNVSCILCARNAELLQSFDLVADLGLDAVDVVDTESSLVAFSTELNGPNFTQGDLLATNGAVIPNRALTWAFGQGAVGFDAGLDAVHFVGDPGAIATLLDQIRANPLQEPGQLSPMLEEAGLDILFSTEAGWTVVGAPGFLDGDLLSARDGIIVAANSVLLPASVPAGLPSSGVDFGLDAATTDRSGARPQIHFSTEILFDGEPLFTDGDVLLANNGIVMANRDLTWCFEPTAEFLGLDALHMALEPPGGDVEGRKFHDLDADGVADAGEPGLAQWEIHLDGQDLAGNAISEVAWTDPTGVYTFTATAGTYTVSEVCPAVAAWTQSLPLPADGVCGTGVYDLDIAPGDPPQTGLDFGNYQVIAQYLPVVFRNSP